MPLDLLTLASGTLAQASSLSASHRLYRPSPDVPKKTAIVHAMRFTNVSGGAAKIHVFFLKSTGAIGTDERRLLPKDFVVPSGYTLVDDDQLTLDAGDGVYAFSDIASAIDYALSGSERPL